MKRILCLVLVALLIAAAAFAESAAAPAANEAAALTEPEKLAKMIPVLDSFARNMDLEGERVYDPNDAAFVWDQLYLMGVNWYQDELLPEEEAPAFLVVPADVMSDYAKASFADLAELPEIPATDPNAVPSVALDANTGDYNLQLSDAAASYIMIERYAAKDDALWVDFGIYDGETNLRQGGLVAVMVEKPAEENPFTLDPEQESAPRFPYAVKDVHPETALDFADLDATLCAIRYEEPEVEAAEENAAQPAANPAYTALARGNRGENVRALQHRLNELGYACGSEDGIFGPRTHQAVRYFQDALGVSQSGAASEELQARLFAANAPAFEQYVTLRRGSRGVRVEKLQSGLRKLGYLSQPVDGSFGPRTETAVKLFQNAAHLREDGLAGAKTLSALEGKNAPNCEVYIDLYRGDTGIRVTEMQKQLAKLGLYSGKTNGVYDKKTTEAVKTFMANNGISGDGKQAAAATIRKMFQAPAPTATPTVAPTAEPTATPTVEPTTEPTVEPTVEPTAEPTEEPTVEPTVEPTAEPTVEPTEEPTVEPTVEPTEEPTAEPTVEPTAEPTPEPVCVIKQEELQDFVDAVNKAKEETKEAKEVVTWLQQLLKLEAETGVYDQATKDAVTKFQKDNSLEETGLVDEVTLTKLLEYEKTVQ